MDQFGKLMLQLIVIVITVAIHSKVVEDQLVEIETKNSKHEQTSTNVSSHDEIRLRKTDTFEDKEDSFSFLEKITEAYMKRDNYSLRKTRSIDNKTTKFVEQFEKNCNSSGSQPCTCYYPDHRSIPQFEISADEFSKTAYGVNGSGPANCQDLKHLSYTLRGFYMVRFNSKRIKTIFCEFNNETFSTTKNQVEHIRKHVQRGNFLDQRKSPSIRYCGGVRGKLCTYLYSDHPDALHAGEIMSGKNRKEPTSCEDLKIIGHYLKGFYFVWLSSIKVKIVYCDFSNESMLEGNKTRITRSKSNSTHTESPLYCNGLGSQPCSCYFSNSPNILQFELGNDEITRKALSTDNGPSSCKDLESIGYDLNGFYLVRFSEKILKTIFCKFNKTEMKSSFGKLPLKNTTEKNEKNLIHQQMTSTAKYTDITTAISTFEPTIKKNTTVKKPGFFIKTTKSVRYSLLDEVYIIKNKHDKCMSSKQFNQDIIVVQSICNPQAKEQLWIRTGEYLQNELTGYVSKITKGVDYFDVHIQRDLYESKWLNKKWRITEQGKIESTSGWCLGVKYDSDMSNFPLVLDSCEKKKMGSSGT